MKSFPVNLLTALSLLLCLAAAGLWARGYFVSDEVRWLLGRDTYVLRSYLGGIHAARSREGLFGRGGYSKTVVRSEQCFDFGFAGGGIMELPPHWSDRYPATERTWECCGFAAAVGRDLTLGLRTGPPDPDEGRFAVFVVPCWFLATAAAPLPAARLARAVRRSRRRRRGLCPACGYNLTGNASGVCPECGRTARGIGVAPGVPSAS